MSVEDEPSVVAAPRRKAPKPAEPPPEPVQAAAEAAAQQPTAAEPPKEEWQKTLEAIAVPANEFMDGHGFVAGDLVWLWMSSDKDPDRLEPHPAILCQLLSNGAWKGARFRPITQGYYAVQAMKYSETPLLGHFSKRAVKVS